MSACRLTRDEYNALLSLKLTKSILRRAQRYGLDLQDRGPLQHFSALAYVVHMLDPEEPRRRYSLAESDSPVWVQWRHVRGLDGHSYQRRGYRIPQHTRQAVLARDGYLCGLCGGGVDPADVHIDHRLPRFHGGSDDLDNLQVAHSLCNLSKGARVLA